MRLPRLEVRHRRQLHGPAQRTHDSDFKNKVVLDAYPTREWGGVIWVYMGPKEHMPSDVPQLEWGLVEPHQRRVIKNFQECNYLQALEGDIDTAHVSYLHSTKSRSRKTRAWCDPSAGSTKRPS